VFVRLCFNGNTVVGYDMDNDIKSLGLEPSEFKKDDLADYYVEYKFATNSLKEVREKYSLKDLGIHYFAKNIQCGQHSAIKDSRLTLKLWKKKQELHSTQPIFSDIVKRSGKDKRAFIFDPKDKCNCKKTKGTGKLSFFNV
jgi:hypothetical protein